MSNSSLGIDPRVIPLVRTLKEQNTKSKENITKKITQDISSEKTSENSTNHNKIIINKKAIENEKNKNDEKEKLKSKKSVNRFNNKSNTMIKKNINTKISIDGSAENKVKAGTSDYYRGSLSSNKIQIISKSKEKNQTINPGNTFQLTLGQLKQKKFNNIKTRSKYVQNLLNDMSIKKYKNSCIDILKNDNVVKKLYEQCGFEKTNFSYEHFIQNNFFNKPLFMYKLEMLFLDDNNFTKKNFKENFFKNEIVKYLNDYNNNNIYQKQMTDLNDVFKEGFESILEFDLFHD
jgi:hypothetical protein